MQFRKKPVVIEAEQFDPAVDPWPQGVRLESIALYHTGVASGTVTLEPMEGRFVIFDSAQNGDVPVNPGDWIITGVQGEKYPCKADIFAATYEPVEAADAVREGPTFTTG